MDIAFLRHEGGRQCILGFRNRLYLNRFSNNQVRSIYVMVYNVDSLENKYSSPPMSPGELPVYTPTVC